MLAVANVTLSWSARAACYSYVAEAARLHSFQTALTSKVAHQSGVILRMWSTMANLEAYQEYQRIEDFEEDSPPGEEDLLVHVPEGLKGDQSTTTKVI